MSYKIVVPQPPNAAWSNPIDLNDEDALEQEEINFEEELKQIFTQDINNQNIAGMEMKDEDEEEEEAEEVEDMEEYGEDMQAPVIQ